MGRLWRGFVELGTRVESWWSLGALVMGTGAFAWLAQQWEALASQGWAAVTIFAVLAASLVVGVLSAAFLAFARLKNPAAKPIPQEDGDLTPIYGGHFKNETVDLDGHQFIKCTFVDVTFKYNGGTFGLVECTIDGFGLTSDIHGIIRVVDFVAQILKFDRKEIVDGRGKARISMSLPTGGPQVLSSEPQSLPSIEQKTQP